MEVLRQDFLAAGGRGLGLSATSRLRLRLRTRTSINRYRNACICSASTQEYPEEDYVSKVLRERPSQLEPKYLVGDKYYTLRELQRKQTPNWRRAAEAFRSIIVSPEPKTTSLTGADDELSSRESDAAAVAKSVYLSDLLREFRGDLYVPEEAFEGHTWELKEFNYCLESLPEMALEDFLRAKNSEQVEMLVSRGIASPNGSTSYYDFIVKLKSMPGEQGLHCTQWYFYIHCMA